MDTVSELLSIKIVKRVKFTLNVNYHKMKNETHV